jgi:hypothetical protein
MIYSTFIYKTRGLVESFMHSSLTNDQNKLNIISHIMLYAVSAVKIFCSYAMFFNSHRIQDI